MIYAIDPGTEKSAWLFWNGRSIEYSDITDNLDLIAWAQDSQHVTCPLVIEKVESFGMAVGAEVFETVFWSGRFAQAYGIDKVHRIGRREVKLHLCGSARAKDANVRQAILDRFGGKDKAIGTKKAPGPLYGIKSHLWAALAVAITWHDQNCK